MQFSNTASKDGMIQKCESLLGFDDGDISGNSTYLKIFTGLINARYAQTEGWIVRNQSDWQFDDSNYTTLPIATTTLVADQQDYALPTSARRLERVEVLDSSGNYVVVHPIDKSQVADISMTEYYETSGLPVYYDMVGRSIMLYPKPGTGYVTLAAGLKIYVSRDIVQFNSTATTQEPGLDSHFHSLLPIGACLDYAIGKVPDKVSMLQSQLNDLREGMEEFYSVRHTDARAKFYPNTDSFI